VKSGSMFFPRTTGMDAKLLDVSGGRPAGSSQSR
jgi:hypothetical protein